RAGCNWQKAVVQSVLSRAIGVATLVYAAAIFNGALDNLKLAEKPYFCEQNPTSLVTIAGHQAS
ncbi:MAG TPA: hypothetical protein VJQ26_12430, partial [Ktedonobacteraceae bacterium]|nr:hypothetical protein [Ktedonobacteraceae bacterium]